nr:LuxR C-terminal-related transcriptional regulator [Parvibacter caecicola]
MGRQFLLSRREEEVLVLYAQGYTQKRVADALFISPETAHAHIKRIYAKTELHSRQEIIDYLESFTN